MINYDSSVIQAFAKRLYGRAGTLVALCLCAGGILGAALGILTANREYLLLLVLLGVLFGYLFGVERAFQLKLQAQMALCQVQIELNTRRLPLQCDSAVSDGLGDVVTKSGQLEMDQAAKVDGHRRAARNLASSGRTQAEISKELLPHNFFLNRELKWRNFLPF
jgi:hypothetical protein